MSALPTLRLPPFALEMLKRIQQTPANFDLLTPKIILVAHDIKRNHPEHYRLWLQSLIEVNLDIVDRLVFKILRRYPPAADDYAVLADFALAVSVGSYFNLRLEWELKLPAEAIMRHINAIYTNHEPGAVERPVWIWMLTHCVKRNDAVLLEKLITAPTGYPIPLPYERLCDLLKCPCDDILDILKVLVDNHGRWVSPRALSELPRRFPGDECESLLRLMEVAATTNPGTLEHLLGVAQQLTNYGVTRIVDYLVTQLAMASAYGATQRRYIASLCVLLRRHTSVNPITVAARAEAETAEDISGLKALARPPETLSKEDLPAYFIDALRYGNLALAAKYAALLHDGLLRVLRKSLADQLAFPIESRFWVLLHMPYDYFLRNKVSRACQALEPSDIGNIIAQGDADDNFDWTMRTYINDARRRGAVLNGTERYIEETLKKRRCMAFIIVNERWRTNGMPFLPPELLDHILREER